jgi:arsenate reductase-like glutaredoxin family protein
MDLETKYFQDLLGIKDFPNKVNSYFNNINADFDSKGVELAKEMVLEFPEIFFPLLKQERLRYYHNQMNEWGINKIPSIKDYSGRTKHAQLHAIEYTLTTAWFSDLDKIASMNLNPSLVVISPSNLKYSDDLNIGDAKELIYRDRILKYAKENDSILLLHFPIKNEDTPDFLFGKTPKSFEELNYALLSEEERYPKIKSTLEFWRVNMSSSANDRKAIGLFENQLIQYKVARGWLRRQEGISQILVSAMDNSARTMMKDREEIKKYLSEEKDNIAHWIYEDLRKNNKLNKRDILSKPDRRKIT